MDIQPTQSCNPTIHPLLLHRLKHVAATLLMGSLLQTPALGQSFESTSQTTAASTVGLYNRAAYTYDAINDPLCGSYNAQQQTCPFNETVRIQGYTGSLSTQVTGRLIDPLGRITGCAGEVLTSYTGFSISLYETDVTDPTGSSFRGLVSLTPTDPSKSSNKIPAGAKPNTQNSNPFFLTDGEQGTYNFLLDPQKGQVEVGRSYILVINPPRNSIYSQRRVRIAITARNGNQVSYIASSLDGKPISAADGRTAVTGTIAIANAEQTPLVLAALDLDTSVCQAQEIQIVKTGDRASATPGDTVIYRLSIRNLSNAQINSLAITDVLPLGFDFLAKSVRAELRGVAVPVTSSRNGNTVTFNFTGTALPPGAEQDVVLNVAYAATLTPDAIRGSGLNSAIVNGQRSDNRQLVKDGPAVHRLRVRNGILSDCGTIIGRVFVDKNFDGEQQPGEPGVPNAVVFLDDGTRITTDSNGLFSLANVLSGYRSGVLDLSSTAGYTLAPNQYFKERNSQSRLVHLEPSGLVRMNFAVTPAFGEVGKP